MKRHSPAFFHRILLWSVLIFGATLLMLNAWLVINSDTNYLPLALI